jgi:hypothetical protein
MTDEPLQKIGRIAIRTEGDILVARYAMPDTMEDAIFLASISKSACDLDRGIFEAFMQLARTIVAVILKDTTGADVTWKDPERAPEHERAGRG